MGSDVTTVLCYGDSNTWGADPNVSGGRHGYDDRWPTVAAASLGERFRLIPEGLNGRTTVFDDPIEPWRNGLAYLRPCLVSHKPLDIVVIMLGTNDTKGRFAAPASDIAKGMGLLVHAVQTSGTGREGGAPKVGIVAPPHVREETGFGEQFHGARERSLGLAAEYRLIAEQFNCAFLDAADGVTCPIPDGIHLGVHEQRRLGQLIAAWIREELAG